MKIFKLFIYILTVSFLSTSFLYSQEPEKKKMSETDLTSLKIEKSKEISKLVIYEEPDAYRITSDDSTGTKEPVDPELLIRKKIRLDDQELKEKFPMAVYEYPDGTLEIDYLAVLSILYIRCNEYEAQLKKLEEEVQALESTKK